MSNFLVIINTNDIPPVHFKGSRMEKKMLLVNLENKFVRKGRTFTFANKTNSKNNANKNL